MLRIVVQVAILALTIQSLVDCKCFDEYQNKHLSTYVKKVDGRTEEECPGSCLTYPGLCQSAQYDRTNEICYLNIETHLSAPATYKNNDNYVYWYRRKECQPHCYFVYYWKKYLLGYNDNKFLSYSSRQCLESCLLNQNYDCKSIDYGRDNGECTLSRESKDTKPAAWKPHITLEHFHKICKFDPIEETPCYESAMDGTYMINHAQVFSNKDEKTCQRLCFTANYVCRSIHYDKVSKKCYLNKETHLSKPGWVKNHSKYTYWMRDAKCDYNCYYVYNYRTYIDGYILTQYNGYTSNQCIEACYEDPSCKSFDYKRNSKICRLHTESKLTKPNAAKSSSEWENYHKICRPINKEYNCFTSYSNKYINDKYIVFQGKTEEECVKLCLFGEFPCRSASYDKQLKKCFLSRKTKNSHPALYFSNKNYRYFEKHSQCQTDCAILTFPKYYIVGNTIRSTSADSDIDCLKLCLTEKPSGECKSVSWRRSTKTCILHNESRLTMPSAFKPSSLYIHWHLSCTGDYCYNEYPFRYLANQHYTLKSDSSEGGCKSVCLKSEGCKSAYFDASTEKCYLSKETRLSKPASYLPHNNMVYWERKSVCKADCYMKEYKNYYLQGLNTKSVKVANQLECKQQCFLEKAFTCASAEYNTRTKMCYLSTANRKTAASKWRGSSLYIYWEKTCGHAYPCFNRYHQRYLQLKYYKVYNGISEEACAFQCEKSLCSSANYNTQSNACYLSKHTKKDYPKSYKVHFNYVYLEKKASCKPDCYYREYSNRYLNSPSLQRYVGSETECLKLCLKYRSWCKSADYRKINKRCSLSSKNQITGGGLKISFLYNYYELTCEGQVTKDYPCFTAYPKKYLQGYTNKNLFGITEKNCLKACFLANFVCRSAEYSPLTKTCSLSVQSKTTKPLSYKSHAFLTYYHRKPECYLGCPIKTYKNKVLANFNTKFLTTSSDYDCINECLTTKGCRSVERNQAGVCYDRYDRRYLTTSFAIRTFYTRYINKCKASCLEAKFVCKSLQYNIPIKTCYLFDKTKDTIPLEYGINYSYIYWQRKPECLLNCYLKPFHDSFLVATPVKTLSMINELRCQENCLTEKSFQCKSINYKASTSTCYLNSLDRDGAIFQTLQPYRWYFERVCPVYPCFNAVEDIKLQRLAVILPVAKPEDCMENCLRSKFCRSTNYNKHTKKCYIYSTVRSFFPPNTIHNTKFVYYEKSAECSTSCNLQYSNNLYLDGVYINKYDSVFSNLKCLELCYQNPDGCRSVQRNSKTNECFINLKTKAESPFKCKSSSDFEYWQLKCDGCFSQLNGKYLTKFNRYLHGKSKRECKLSCLTADFNCKSAQYDIRTGVCFLSDETRFTVPHHFQTNFYYTYWDRSIACNPNCYFKFYRKKYLLGHNTLMINPLSREECLEKCFTTATFNCLSVDYNGLTKNCVLSSESKDTKPLDFKKHHLIDHYHKMC
ncbi:DgyrCDS12446 [Dimorphilus gyrociliatus]|uniref:DgyrCDS12446 n=1 Tax=Dimorphilus gyrociliatus TaxID=2664684 RepID=A0A7I8W7N7_9ANNE|nr:DgyrCDS12446 [Dimorphilus gyrociliatus]